MIQLTNRQIYRFWANVDVGSVDECWMWTGYKQTPCKTGEAGYGRYRLMRDRIRHVFRTHRLSWILHNGRIPDRMQVLHTCDVRLCVNPKHLFLGTAHDNVRDMLAKRRQARGTAIKQAKLDEESVRWIRKHYSKQGLWSLQPIAAKFGVHPATITSVIKRETWGWVSDLGTFIPSKTGHAGP